MTTHNGYFWDPTQPDIKQFGKLEIDEIGNSFLLTLNGLLNNIIPAMYNINFHNDIALIHGVIGERLFISIYNLRLIDVSGNLLDVKQYSIGTTAKLSFKFAICGINLFDTESLFDTIITTPQYGHQWTSDSRIKKNYGSTSTNVKSEYQVIDLISDTFTTDFTEVCSELCTSEIYRSLDSEVEIKESLEITFNLKTNSSAQTIQSFVQDFHRFYSLAVGQKLGLTSILLKDVEENKYHRLFISNNPISKSFNSAPPENRLLSYDEFLKGTALNSFIKNKTTFQLPLDYYFSFVYGGNQGDTNIYFILFLSALEVIYNREHSHVNNESLLSKNSRQFDEVITKVTNYLSPKELQFLTKGKHTKSLRDKTIKDKLIELIEISPKLMKLVKDHVQFSEEIKSMRHYLIHEEIRNDLEFINDPQGLRKRIVHLKIILEYHLLIALGFRKEEIENKIDKSMNNFMHFGH